MDVLVKLLLIIVFGYAALYTFFGLIGMGKSILKGRWLIKVSFILTVLVIISITGVIHIGNINPIFTFNGVNTVKKIAFTAGLGVVIYMVLYFYFKLSAFLIGKIFKGK